MSRASRKRSRARRMGKNTVRARLGFEIPTPSGTMRRYKPSRSPGGIRDRLGGVAKPPPEKPSKRARRVDLFERVTAREVGPQAHVVQSEKNARRCKDRPDPNVRRGGGLRRSFVPWCERKKR